MERRLAALAVPRRGADAIAAVCLSQQMSSNPPHPYVELRLGDQVRPYPPPHHHHRLITTAFSLPSAEEPGGPGPLYARELLAPCSAAAAAALPTRTAGGALVFEIFR